MWRVQRGQRDPYIILQTARESCEGDRCKPVLESSQDFFLLGQGLDWNCGGKWDNLSGPFHGCETARSKGALSHCGISKCWDCKEKASSYAVSRPVNTLERKTASSLLLCQKCIFHVAPVKGDGGQVELTGLKSRTLGQGDKLILNRNLIFSKDVKKKKNVIFLPKCCHPVRR